MVSLKTSHVDLLFFVLLNVSLPYGRLIINLLIRDGPEVEEMLLLDYLGTVRCVQIFTS